MFGGCFKRVSDDYITPIIEVSLLHGFGGSTSMPGRAGRRPFDYQVFGIFGIFPLTSLLTFSLNPFCFCQILTFLAKIQEICRNRLFTSHPGAVTADCFRAAVSWAWTKCQASVFVLIIRVSALRPGCLAEPADQPQACPLGT